MAIDFINIDTTNPNIAPLAASLKNCVSVGRQFYTMLSTLKDQFSHLNDGTIFTAIETKCGLPSGKGQIVFDLVNGAKGSMEGTFQVADAKTLTEKLG